MKTLKCFVILIIFFFLPFANINAQVKKVVTTETFSFCEEFPCVGEVICGEFVLVHTIWLDNNQIKMYQLNYSGSGVGLTSGALYKGNEVEKAHGFFDPTGELNNHNYVFTTVLKKEGGPAIVIHSMYHITYDVNGGKKMEFERLISSCD